MVAGCPSVFLRMVKYENFRSSCGAKRDQINFAAVARDHIKEIDFKSNVMYIQEHFTRDRHNVVLSPSPRKN